MSWPNSCAVLPTYSSHGSKYKRGLFRAHKGSVYHNKALTSAHLPPRRFFSFCWKNGRNLAFEFQLKRRRIVFAFSTPSGAIVYFVFVRREKLSIRVSIRKIEMKKNFRMCSEWKRNVNSCEGFEFLFRESLNADMSKLRTLIANIHTPHFPNDRKISTSDLPFRPLFMGSFLFSTRRFFCNIISVQNVGNFK